MLGLAIALLCGALGWVIGNNRAIPDPNSTDIGFLQDMRTHHEQAVYLSLYYLSAAGHRPEHARSSPARSCSIKASTSDE